MSDFLHNLAEGLRTREKLLEEHSTSTLFDKPEGGAFKQEYDALMEEIKRFRERIEKAKAAKKDFDEHFERKIDEDNRQLAIKIDTWQKTYKR